MSLTGHRRKEKLVGYKKYRLLKKAVFGIFPKRLTHKFEMFSFFIFFKINLEVFASVLDR